MKNRAIQTSFEGVHRVLCELKVSRTTVIQFLGVSTFGFLISLALFSGVYAFITGNNEGLHLHDASELFLAFLLLILPIPLHELLHGAVISFYGGKPRYGLGIFYFILPYAYVTTEKVFTRDQFIRICLAPLLIISTVGVVLMPLLRNLLLIIPLAANAAGAVGDVWISIILLRYPKHILVEDSKSVLRIYGKTDDKPVQLHSSRLLKDFLTAFSISFVGLFIMFNFIMPFILIYFGVESFSIGFQNNSFSLFHWGHKKGEFFHYSIGFLGILTLSSAVGLLYGFGRSIVHHKES